MNTFPVRTFVTSALIGFFLLPAYGHHGTQFLSRAIEMSAAEVRLGIIACDKTHNTQVGAFAEKMVADQDEALRKLMDLRAARTMIRATPVSANGFAAETGRGMERIHRSAGDIPMTPDHHRTLERLSLLPTAEFDLQFVNDIIREYRETIAFFEGQAHVHGNEVVRASPRDVQDYSPEELLKNLDTTDFAIAALPGLRHRLKEAEALQKRLQKR